MIAQGRNIDQVLSHLLLQLTVEREERLRKMSRFMCLSYNVISDVCHTMSYQMSVIQCHIRCLSYNVISDVCHTMSYQMSVIQIHYHYLWVPLVCFIWARLRHLKIVLFNHSHNFFDVWRQADSKRPPLILTLRQDRPRVKGVLGPLTPSLSSPLTALNTLHNHVGDVWSQYFHVSQKCRLRWRLTVTG